MEGDAGMRMVSISQFLSERNVNLPQTKYERIYKLALLACRAGLSERIKNKSNRYSYDERVLEEALSCITNDDETSLFLAAIKKLDKSEPELTPEPEEPDAPKPSPGFITIKAFCEKYEVSDRGEMSRLASSLFAAGLIERQKLRGKNLMAYRESDLAEIARNCAARKASGDLKKFKRGKKADEAQAEPTPAPPDISPALSCGALTLHPVAQPEEVKPAVRFEYKPGIFVRVWRWFFGYRKEVGV